MSHGPLPQLLLLLVLGLPLVLIARRFGANTLVAYLVTGAVAGTLGWIHHHDVHQVGEIGASLLLFSLGLELDLPAMRKRIRLVLISAVGQLGLTILAGTLLMYTIGVGLRGAFIIGCCLSLSSTLMVLRALDEHHLRQKEEGNSVLGLLLAQDFFIAPLLVVVTIVANDGNLEASAIVKLIIGLFVIIGLTIVLRKILASRLISRIKMAQVPELEVAFGVIMALGAAYVSEQFGMGAAVGAFCAGLALGGDEHSHAIETSTRPLQGLMAIFFFTSVGVQFNVEYVLNNIHLVLGALVISVGLKALLAGFAFRLAGMPVRNAIGCGIMVGQIGEFSFVLVSALAGINSSEAISNLYDLIIAVACLSLAATPLLISISLRFLPRSDLSSLKRKGNTIVVAGLGPVGNTIVETLQHSGHELFLVDRNVHHLQSWEDKENVRTHMAQIEDMDSWLPNLGERPLAVFLTFPIADTSALVADRILRVDPGLNIIARCPFMAQISTLRAAGIRHVICDEHETARALVPILEDLLVDDRRLTQTYSEALSKESNKHRAISVSGSTSANDVD